MTDRLRSGQLAAAAGVTVGAHRGPRPGLRGYAEAKLVEIDARIAQLAAIRVTLAEVVAAGCSDLTDCSCTPACPIPFTALDVSASAQVASTLCPPANRL